MRLFVASAGSFFLFMLFAGFSPVQQPVQSDGSRKLASIEFDGNKVFDQATLLRSLRFVRIGGPYAPGALDADVQMNLTGFLKENGYLLCETSWREHILSDGSVGIRIQVVEGNQYRLASLKILGAKFFAAEELARQFHLRPGDVANFAEVQKGLERIKQMYTDSGYIDFSYIPDQRFNTANLAVDLTLTMEEGLRYRVAYIGIVGCGDQPEEDRVRALIVLHPGEFFSQGALDASVAAINKMGLYREIKKDDYTLAPLDEKPGLLSVVFYLNPNVPPR